MSSDHIDPNQLRGWLASGRRGQAHVLGQGYQAKAFVYELQDDTKLVIKTAKGWGLKRWLRQWMLRREYAAYRRLNGLNGIPHCFGLIDGRYLVLEYIEGSTFRERQDALRRDSVYFDRLRQDIAAMHHRGVAHTDLKCKDNLMVRTSGQPCMIDFGVAVVRKPGFAPINHFFYRIAKRFDQNAWLKLKYGHYRHIPHGEAAQLYRTPIERGAHWLKARYREYFKHRTKSPGAW